MRWSVIAVWAMSLVPTLGMWQAMQLSSAWRAAVGSGMRQPFLVADEAARGSVRPVPPAPGGGADRGMKCSRGPRRWRCSSGWRASARPGHGPGAAGCPRLDEDRDELVEREARAEVPDLATGPGKAVGPLEMTLLADRLAERGGQVTGVDDRRVQAAADLARPADVQGTGAMASLAADWPDVHRGHVAIEGAPAGIGQSTWQDRHSGVMTRSK